MEKQILHEINKRKNIYKTSPDDMIAAYNREMEAGKEYNGRQLLELLQNADDEHSSEVCIELNTNEKLLKIYNRGSNCKPFSFEGIKSLMISNLSPKVTKNYIGNKGLGFRSIINWSKTITINSNNIDIVFSRSFVDSIFNELFYENQQKEFTIQRNLAPDVKPIPFLAIPSIKNNIQVAWTTIISIEYKEEFLNDIREQLSELKDEILLFLNHIDKLEIKFNDVIKTIERIKSDKLIYINDVIWTIYEKSGILSKDLWDKESEKEFYELKIALRDDLKNDNKLLFSYFPTKININFPFIIHGTFELNSSRNALNKSDKNKFILKKLVELIIETAKSLSEKEVSYKPLELLTYKNQDNILEDLRFYSEIDKAIEKLNVFPCIDNQYRNREAVIYINDEFSSFMEKVCAESLFPNMLKPINNTNIDLSKFDIEYSIDDTLKINQVSQKISTIEDRIELISLLLQYSSKEKFELLIDRNGDLIRIEDSAYTPSKLDFKIPYFVKIKFIQEELFQKMLIKFNIQPTDNARILQRKLKSITNIQSYEPAQVLQRIITSTNRQLERNETDKNIIVNQMVQSLYENYKNLSDGNKVPTIPVATKVQLINKTGNLLNANDLYLSKTYPSGEITEELFGDIFSEDQFIADAETYDFDNKEEIEQIERFFQWLGVNRHTKFEIITNQPLSYFEYVFGNKQKPIDYRSGRVTFKSIWGFNTIINKLSYEKIILWIIIDDEIRKQLDDRNNTDTFKYEKKGDLYGSFHNEIYIKPSFITYQFRTLNLFNEYLISNEKLSPLVNQIEIDYDSDLLQKFKINRADIESILLKIGAKDRFEDLSINKIKTVLKKLPETTKDGKQTQKIYKLAIKHYEKNRIELDEDELLLYASKNGNMNYYNRNEVYYSGHIKLPKKITEKKAIFNYPRRQNTENVVKFFGISNLNSLDLSIESYELIDRTTNEFNDFFQLITPYILVYRIKDVENDKTAKSELKKIRKISILLCASVVYRVDDEEYQLEDNDYIVSGDNYLIKVDPNLTIDNLRQDFDFTDTFADIIGLVFDITETKIFRDMVKDEISYIEKLIRSEIGDDEIIRAKELLGISDESYSFWKTVFTLKNRDYISISSNYSPEKIKKDLSIATNIDKIDLKKTQSHQSCRYIELLFNELDINVADYNNSKYSYYKLNFQNYHNHNLKQCLNDNQKSFKQSLYLWCQKNDSEGEFVNLIGQYEHSDIITENQLILQELTNIDYQYIVETFLSNKFNFSIKKSIDNV